MKIKDTVYILLATGILSGGAALVNPESSLVLSGGQMASTSQEFDAYWNTGKAEISSYNLEMARYGELHSGKSVLVFVTEPFLIEKQVKKEMPSDAMSTQVLKLNKIDRFTTGIYDYSLMLSTFTPIQSIDYPFCIKTSFSAQDWCGQSYMQLNRRGNGYQAELRSYFESEGDKSRLLEGATLEDELWTRARLNPKTLPTGSFEVIASSQQQRLRHEPVMVEQAEGTLNLEMKADGSEQFVYRVAFPSGRELTMNIQTVFPYRIYGWQEKVKSGFGASAQWLTTVATIDKSIKSSYWGENKASDEVKRKGLGLD